VAPHWKVFIVPVKQRCEWYTGFDTNTWTCRPCGRFDPRTHPPGLDLNMSTHIQIFSQACSAGQPSPFSFSSSFRARVHRPERWPQDPWEDLRLRRQTWGDSETLKHNIIVRSTVKRETSRSRVRPGVLVRDECPTREAGTQDVSLEPLTKAWTNG